MTAATGTGYAPETIRTTTTPYDVTGDRTIPQVGEAVGVRHTSVC